MPRPQRPVFTITKKTRIGRARLGTLTTPHGVVHTPAYVIVATHAAVKTLNSHDIKRTGTQVVIANTYHLMTRAPKARRGDFVAKQLGTKLPTMTDSGGFQVFSFGRAREYGVGKVLKRGRKRERGEPSLVKITERGVTFTAGGRRRVITPEKSILLQEQLGADVIFAFDECTSPLETERHTRTAMNRTHRWALRCLKARTRTDQMLMGIVQGGRFKRLRTASAKAIGAMPFDGFGIGGSYDKAQLSIAMDWVVPHLPKEKYRHLLGIGTVADVFSAVEHGADTMDCVIPTREGRHGRIYTTTGTRHMKITSPEDARRATMLNVRFFNTLMKNIRAALADGSYRQFKKEFLKSFSRG